MDENGIVWDTPTEEVAKEEGIVWDEPTDTPMLEKTPDIENPNDPFLNKSALDPTNEVATEAETRLEQTKTLQESGGQTLKDALVGETATPAEQEFVDDRVDTATNLVTAESNEANLVKQKDIAKKRSNVLISKAEDSVAKLDNIYKNITKQGWTAESKTEIRNINKTMVEILYGQGYDSVELDSRGTITWVNPETNEREQMTGSIFKDLMAAKFEAGAAIAGASAASRIPVAHPIAKAGTVIAGGAVGAMTGKALDLYANALDSNVDLASVPWLDQIGTAGAVDAVFALGGTAVAKTIGAGFNLVKEALRNKDLDKAMSHLESINPNFRLKEDGTPTEDMMSTTDKYLKSYGMDDEAIALMKETEPDTYKRAVVEAVVTTDPKYSSIVKELASDDALAVRISDQVKERADVVKNQLTRRNEVTSGQNVVDNLVEADEAAKGLYYKAQANTIKAFDGTQLPQKAGDAIRGGTQSFAQQMMSDPSLQATLTKGKLGRLFSATMKLGNDVKDMNGILNLRDSVAELAKKAKLEDNPFVQDYLKKLDGTIDGVIDNNAFLSTAEKGGLKSGLTKGREFVETSSATMKSNLFKAIQSGKGKNHDNIMDSFIKYASSEDGMYEKVASTLSAAERDLLEQSMIKRATNKHLQGDNINYQNLSETLQSISPRLQSEAGQESVRLAQGMADLFQNDELLSTMTSEFRRGSKSAKVEPVFTMSGSGIGNTVSGKAKTAMATAKFRLLKEGMNFVADIVFGLALKTPVISKVAKALPRGKEIIKEQNREAILYIMEQQLTKPSPTFVGLAKDLAQVDTLPKEAKQGLKDFISQYTKVQEDIDSSVSNFANRDAQIPNDKVGGADELPNPNATTMSESELNAQGRREFREDADNTKRLPVPKPTEIYKRDVMRKWFSSVKDGVEDKSTLKALIKNVEKNLGTPKQEKSIQALDNYAKDEGIDLPAQYVQGQLKPKGANETGIDVAKPKPPKKRTQTTMQFEATPEASSASSQAGVTPTKGNGLPSEFNRRAATGNMSRWKDEAVKGFGGKKTYGEVFDSIQERWGATKKRATSTPSKYGIESGRESSKPSSYNDDGFTPSEIMSIVSSLYNAKTKVAFNRILKDMQLDDLID